MSLLVYSLCGCTVLSGKMFQVTLAYPVLCNMPPVTAYMQRFVSFDMVDDG